MSESNDDDSTLAYVASCIENEGFWYCFNSFSDFEEVQDATFHRLREEFLAAGKALRDHVEGKTS